MSRSMDGPTWGTPKLVNSDRADGEMQPVLTCEILCTRFPSCHQRFLDMPDCCGAVLGGSPGGTADGDASAPIPLNGLVVAEYREGVLNAA